jgi:hypothetical protein
MWLSYPQHFWSLQASPDLLEDFLLLAGGLVREVAGPHGFAGRASLIL